MPEVDNLLQAKRKNSNRVFEECCKLPGESGAESQPLLHSLHNFLRALARAQEKTC